MKREGPGLLINISFAATTKGCVCVGGGGAAVRWSDCAEFSRNIKPSKSKVNVSE